MLAYTKGGVIAGFYGNNIVSVILSGVQLEAQLANYPFPHGQVYTQEKSVPVLHIKVC